MKEAFKRLFMVLKPFYKIAILIVFLVAILLIIDKSGKKHERTKKRFALIQFNDSPLSDMSKKGIIDGFSSIGYTLNKDYDLNASNAQGDIASLNLMIDAVITDRPDLLFVTSTPTLQTAAKKIKDIPVIFTVVADPIIAGAGTSFDNHLSNITGISTLGDYEGMIRWVQKLLPAAREIGTLFSPGESNSVKNMTELKKYAELAGLKLITVPVNTSQEITDATLLLTSRKPDVICQIVDNLTSCSAGSIISTAKDHKIPVFGFVSDQSKMGAVLVVSRDYHQAGVDAVILAKKILDGESPAKVPFQFVSKTHVLINPSAAAFFKIPFSADLLQDKNIIITK